MFIDTHCHLNFDQFKMDLDDELSKAHSVGVKKFLVPSVCSVVWEDLISWQLAYESKGISIALGVHPWWASEEQCQQLNYLEELLSYKSAIALGEIGLDGLKDNYEIQCDLFEKQLGIAKNLNLPVTVHSVKAHSDVVSHLKKVKGVTGVIHGFSGSYEQAQLFVDLGFKIGVGGTITFDRAKKTKDAISRLDVNSLVLETDAPAMPLQHHRTQRNSPIYIPEVFNALLSIRDESEDYLKKMLLENSFEVFPGLA